MTDDRKRFLISIASAVVLHIAVLILTGLNSFNYEIPEEYGPLIVEISMPAIEVIEKEAEKVPVQETINEHQDPQPAPEASAVIEAPAEPEPVPAVSPTVKTVAKAVPVPAPASYSRTEPDEDFLAALKNRSAGTGGTDARALFGDDAVPAVTDRPDALQASGQATESQVVLSDLPASREEDYQTDVKSTVDSRVQSVLAEDDLSSLDASLSAGLPAPSAGNTGVSLISGTTDSDFSGTSPFIEFKDQEASRALARWEHPEIPDEIRKEGARRYTVVIDFFVDADGFISESKVRQSSGKAAIDAAVRSVMRNWVFEQAASDDSNRQKKIPATLTYVIEIK